MTWWEWAVEIVVIWCWLRVLGPAQAGRAAAWLFGLHGPGCRLGWALARSQLGRARRAAELAELKGRLDAEWWRARYPNRPPAGEMHRHGTGTSPPRRGGDIDPDPDPPMGDLPPPPPPYRPCWEAIVPMEGGRVPRSWRRGPPDPGWDPGAWRDTDWARANGAGRDGSQ